MMKTFLVCSLVVAFASARSTRLNAQTVLSPDRDTEAAPPLMRREFLPDNSSPDDSLEGGVDDYNEVHQHGHRHVSYDSHADKRTLLRREDHASSNAASINTKQQHHAEHALQHKGAHHKFHHHAGGDPELSAAMNAALLQTNTLPAANGKNTLLRAASRSAALGKNSLRRGDMMLSEKSATGKPESKNSLSEVIDKIESETRGSPLGSPLVVDHAKLLRHELVALLEQTQPIAAADRAPVAEVAEKSDEVEKSEKLSKISEDLLAKLEKLGEASSTENAAASSEHASAAAADAAASAEHAQISAGKNEKSGPEDAPAIEKLSETKDAASAEQKSTDKSTDKSIDKSAEKSTEKSTAKSTDKSAEKSSGQQAEDAAPALIKNAKGAVVVDSTGAVSSVNEFQ